MNQHYVPRVYLKHFAEKKGSEYYIDVLDKHNQKGFNANITKICSEKHLYTLDEDNRFGDPMAIEKMFAVGFEPMYQRAFEILTNDEIIHVTHEQRQEIIASVIQLYTRNPRILKISIEHHTELIQQVYHEAIRRGQKGMTYLDEDYSFRDWTEATIIAQVTELVKKDFKVGNIHRLNELGTFHEFAKLEVRKVKGSSTFFTSDHPLTIEDKTTLSAHPMDRSVEFTLPLNPKYWLRIYHDNQHDLNLIWRTPAKNVDTALGNQTTYQQASRFLLGTKPSFSEYFEMEKALFQDNSLSRLMYFVRVTVDHIEKEQRHDEFSLLLKKYVDLFDAQRYLTPTERLEFYQLYTASNLQWRQSRLT